MNDLKMTCSLNYEAEYERIKEENDCLKAKLADTTEKARRLHEENLRYQSFMKTMEFVLGRKFDG